MILIPTIGSSIARRFARARVRARALSKKSFIPQTSPTLRPARRVRAHRTPDRIPVGRRARGQAISIASRARARVTRARALARARSRTSRAPIGTPSRRARARDARRARRRREFAARAFKIEPARVARGQGMKRSRDDGPGAGAAIKRCARDAMRSRCDRASTTPRARRARDATTTRDAGFDSRRDRRRVFVPPSTGRSGGRPTTGGFAATDGADDDEARDDERAMTDDERAIAIASQTGDVERGRRRGERSERKGAQAGGVELLEGAQGAFAR